MTIQLILRPLIAALLLLLLGSGGMGVGPAAVDGQDLFTDPDPDAVPVLLVPGWGDGASDLVPAREWFLAEGWTEASVQAVGFDDPWGSNEANARELARAVESLRGLTGAERVDVVAHSMGGLALRHYLRFEGGHERVRRAVFLGTPHRGTAAAMLAWGEGGREMVPGSDFLTRLNADNGVPEEVEALAIRTPVDIRVIPGSSAMLLGALNLEICCPTHPQLVEDEETLAAVVNFLRFGREGVPDAEVPGERTEWRGSGLDARTLEGWGPWRQGWADELVRRWFLPTQHLRLGPEARDPDGDPGSR